ncbi:MAG: hypothetical protein JNM17_08620 [Archangium sp.]|nr:hypothetical protein [Archangium sp.]
MRCGKWERVHPRTIRIRGSPDTWDQQLHAAKLWLGSKYVFSHQTAAALHGLRNFERAAPVIATVERHMLSKTIQLHQGPVHHKDQRVIDGFPVTSVPRTAIDLAGVLDGEAAIRSMVDEMVSRRLMSLDVFKQALDRNGGARGTALLLHILHEYEGGDGASESELEDRVYALCKEYGFPKPKKQRAVYDGKRFRRLDLLFEGFGVIIEADSSAYHSSPEAFEADRQRINALHARGFIVLHWTWSAIEERPYELVDELRRVLQLRQSLLGL